MSEAELLQLHPQALASSGQLTMSREIFRWTLDLARRYNRHEQEALVASRAYFLAEITRKAGPHTENFFHTGNPPTRITQS